MTFNIGLMANWVVIEKQTPDQFVHQVSIAWQMLGINLHIPFWHHYITAICDQMDEISFWSKASGKKTSWGNKNSGIISPITKIKEWHYPCELRRFLSTVQIQLDWWVRTQDSGRNKALQPMWNMHIEVPWAILTILGRLWPHMIDGTGQ